MRLSGRPRLQCGARRLLGQYLPEHLDGGCGGCKRFRSQSRKADALLRLVRLLRQPVAITFRMRYKLTSAFVAQILTETAEGLEVSPHWSRSLAGQIRPPLYPPPPYDITRGTPCGPLLLGPRIRRRAPVHSANFKYTIPAADELRAHIAEGGERNVFVKALLVVGLFLKVVLAKRSCCNIHV